MVISGKMNNIFHAFQKYVYLKELNLFFFLTFATCDHYLMILSHMELEVIYFQCVSASQLLAAMSLIYPRKYYMEKS